MDIHIRKVEKCVQFYNVPQSRKPTEETAAGHDKIKTVLEKHAPTKV